jgi:hypothetical protein
MMTTQQHLQVAAQLQQQKRNEILAQSTLIRKGFMEEEANERSEHITKVAETEQRSVWLFEQRRKKLATRDALLEDARARKDEGMIPFKRESLLTAEVDKRGKRLVLEEKCRRSISLLMNAERRDVCLVESMRKLLKAEAAKRDCVERNEERETLAFATTFKKTPWKPTLWVLGECPFTSKHNCPFQNGLCHGRQPSPKAFGQVG